MADFRELIQELAQSQKPLFILRELAEALAGEEALSSFLAADNLLADLDLTRLPLKPVRVYFLRSATMEQLLPVLRVKCLLAGLRAELEMGAFGQYHQEALAPQSPLYEFAPDIIVVAVRLVDLAPELVNAFASLGTAEIHAARERVLATMHALLTQIRGRTNAHILVHNFEGPTIPAYGIFDGQQPGGQVETIQDLNRALRDTCRSVPGVYLFDYEGLSSRYGKMRWVDARLWHMARMAPNPHLLPHLADEYLRYFLPLCGLTRKCLVLDLDGTLWGGVVGEDGLRGIKLGATYPGSAFVEFQRALLSLAQRGVILAVCSKNNEADALEVFDQHPDMVLRREHFASMRINWQDKASNIREIAQEINIGLDSLVYLDDNPAEIAQVRQAIPEVLAYQLPAAPEAYTAFLQSLPVFESVKITADDRRRGEEYRQQAARRSLAAAAASLEEYYQSLSMRATFIRVGANDATLPRIAQLIQKTNQFNLTTRRYTEQELQRNIEAGVWHVYGLDLEDRFGRNGLIAVGILEVKQSMVGTGTVAEDGVYDQAKGEANPPARGVGEQLPRVCDRAAEIWINTLLLSCRVMGRTVENTFVYYLARAARELGYQRLIGEYIPTAKNSVVADLYQSLGFTLTEKNAEHSLWALDLDNLALAPSPYIKVEGDVK